MLWCFKNDAGACFLDDLAEIHDRHAVADIAHDLEIMADENHGNAVAFLQITQ
ncbi:hypothetical protein D3C81_2311340 [compost metagenome]